ncbi:MAG: GxxExxY protein [Kiritimatiellae bacterium]|nr:GxxExxY protein [Kiritimatiellia bacterium]
MTDEEANKVCDRIRQVAYDLHMYLGVGFLEKVYENALAHRLGKAGMDVQTQVPIQVSDEDGFVIGDYIADLLVDGILVELKAVSSLTQAHVAQLLNYLKATGIRHGLLVNFGSEKFQCRKLAGKDDRRGFEE